MTVLDWIFKKRQTVASSEKAKGWDVPTALDEATYVRRCLAIEFRDETESRTFRSESAFQNVLTPLNSQRYDAAIQEAKKLLPKYADFDLVYEWLGMAYRAKQQLELSRQVVGDGLGKSKRKCLLLKDMGETEWQSGNIEAALYWMAQALHCLCSNPLDYNAYLLLSYVADGAGLPEDAALCLARVDAMRAGRIRLPSAQAERLTSLARGGRTEAMKKVIQGLSAKYLST
jgi:tetratricopeptide (TPR) repeat protein